MISKSLSLAILGTRGVPARYGGFETFAAELSRRLVQRGHRVTVYCRASLYPDAAKEWEGVRRIDLPAIRHKYLETVSHALLSAIDALGRSYDAVLLCNAANAFVLPLLRAARVPVAINVDGIERMRRKWNALGRGVYLAGETLSDAFADALVADAEVIADYYRARFGANPHVIAYGADFPSEIDTGILGQLGLGPRRYLLYVSRFEPENNPEAVLDAFRRVKTELPLVMVGDAPYARELVERLRATADPRVLFPGAIYGADYRTLQRNALLYIQATEVGGTHPAMIEAMGSGGAVLAHDTPENREVGRDAVRYFRLGPEEGLSTQIERMLADPGALEPLRQAARARSAANYSWEKVTEAYEMLLFGMIGAS
ncbi:MAG TPA: glycosyltransferase [Thermoanaerobaculia bacterium]